MRFMAHQVKGLDGTPSHGTGWHTKSRDWMTGQKVCRYSSTAATLHYHNIPLVAQCDKPMASCEPLNITTTSHWSHSVTSVWRHVNPLTLPQHPTGSTMRQAYGVM